MSDKLIKIAYLYEDLMNTYGDSGDVKILSFLLKRGGYDTQVDNISLGDGATSYCYCAICVNLYSKISSYSIHFLLLIILKMELEIAPQLLAI